MGGLSPSWNSLNQQASKQAGAGKGLGEDTVWAASPNGPKGYSMAYKPMLSKSLVGVVSESHYCLETGWALICF